MHVLPYGMAHTSIYMRYPIRIWDLDLPHTHVGAHMVYGRPICVWGKADFKCFVFFTKTLLFSYPGVDYIEYARGVVSRMRAHYGWKAHCLWQLFCVFLYIYWDFCAVALSTSLCETRNKLFEHCGHLSLSVLQ